MACRRMIAAVVGGACASCAASAADAVAIRDFLRLVAERDARADLDANGVADERDVRQFLSNDGGAPATLPFPIVFVSRQINDRGSAHWAAPRDMPGVGVHSRVRPAAPGRLLVREPDSSVRTLVDGSNPTPASLHLIDVNGPSVSYDGATIVFAGLPDGPYETGPSRSVGAWRLYTIGADGSHLRAITDSSMDLDLTQFGPAAEGLRGYDDFDPVFLPDGRICFSSTRTPTFAQHAGARASNLWVVGADGGDMHRITSERNGADRPLVDPQTGRIVYARWWRNHRFPTDSMATRLHADGGVWPGFAQHIGLTMDPREHVAGPSMSRNYWQLMSVNTDGLELRLWSGRFRSDAGNHAYGGGFSPDGAAFYGNFFPSLTMTDAGGFGGVRRWSRGPEPWTPLVGITELSAHYVNPTNPTSYGVFLGEYAGEPEALPDGRVLVSVAPDIGQDYALWVMSADGSGREPVLDFAGTSELRARVVAARPLPPILRDQYRDDPSMLRPSPLPPPAAGPYGPEGGFFFYSFNVYANAPVDADIVSAPAVGSAASIRFFVDHQRESPGTFPWLDWPIEVAEAPVRHDGAVAVFGLPGNVPMFEQLRSALPAYLVPRTNGAHVSGSAHVAGMNFAPAGRSVTCVGCHAGHTQMHVPNDPADARYSNLAPGASVTVSSTRSAATNAGLIDRRAMKGETSAFWSSAPGQPQDGQWVLLTFPVPVNVREVVLYNPRLGGDAGSTIAVARATVSLCRDSGGTDPYASQSAGPLSASGTRTQWGGTRTRSVLVRLDDVSGTFFGEPTASLAEIEVIAMGARDEDTAPPAGAGSGD